MPRDFLATVVRPNLQELRARDNDMRAAVNAILTIDALAGHIFHAATEPPTKGNDDDYRRALAAQHPYFRILRDASAALKHGELNDPNGWRIIQRAGAAQVRAIGFDEAHWDELQFDAEPQVVLADQTGGFRVALVVAEQALALLESEMTRLGI